MIAKSGYLVESGIAKPSEILMLAFAKKAADEMNERIIKRLGSADIKASTFHSIGKLILNESRLVSPNVSAFATDDKLFVK